jgi:hypothetical protein
MQHHQEEPTTHLAPIHHRSFPPSRSHHVFRFKGPSRGYSIAWGDAEELRKALYTLAAYRHHRPKHDTNNTPGNGGKDYAEFSHVLPPKKSAGKPSF